MTIYLDYNATSPLRDEVKQAMLEQMGESLNPSSIHKMGRAARKIAEEAKAKIAASVGGQKMIFCGSGTEANNLAMAQRATQIISSIEHDSVFKAAKNPTIVNVDAQGLLKLDELEAALKANPNALVSLILANNETGVVQKMKPIAALCKQHGALLHLDAVQAFGKIRLNITELGADLMTICAHKVGGPVGAAALVFDPKLELVQFLKGGGQQQGKRAGTEDVVALTAFATLAEMMPQLLSEAEKMRELRDHLEAEILRICPEANIHSAGAPRLPNTSNFAMPNVESATQLIHFDSANIMVSSGAACSSGKVEVSRVLLAMNAPLAANALRVSIGYKTTREEIDFFIQKWAELFKRTR